MAASAYSTVLSRLDGGQVKGLRRALLASAPAFPSCEIKLLCRVGAHAAWSRDVARIGAWTRALKLFLGTAGEIS